MSTLKTMFFVKNVPTAERVLRMVAAAGIAVWGVIAGGGLGAALLASATVFALTGVFGFCPMCALAGRRLKAKS